MIHCLIVTKRGKKIKVGSLCKIVGPKSNWGLSASKRQASSGFHYEANLSSPMVTVLLKESLQSTHQIKMLWFSVCKVIGTGKDNKPLVGWVLTRNLKSSVTTLEASQTTCNSQHSPDDL